MHMASRSSIESHPQKQQIIEGLLAGKTFRDIAGTVTPPVSLMALSRYKRTVVGPTLDGAGVLAKALQTVADNSRTDVPIIDPKTVTAVALAADPFLARINKLRQDRARIKDQAEENEDLRAWSALDRNDLSELELHAKLTGRLDPTPKSTSVTFMLLPAAAAGQQSGAPAQITRSDDGIDGTCFSAVDAVDAEIVDE